MNSALYLALLRLTEWQKMESVGWTPLNLILGGLSMVILFLLVLRYFLKGRDI